MYSQQISIKIKTETDRNDLADELSILMARYRDSGQTQGDINAQYINRDKLVAFAYTHENDSLDKRNNSIWVNKQLKRVERLCGAKLKYNILGIYYASEAEPCKCAKTKFYILFTHLLSIESPVSCGTCFKSVPLYKLPKDEYGESRAILSWTTNYTACDELNMNGEVGERWALNQLQSLDSQLSKQGLAICGNLQRLTSVPTYYYLHDYRKSQKEKQCPNCGKDWKLKHQLHSFFDYKCDYCKLLSVVSPNK